MDAMDYRRVTTVGLCAVLAMVCGGCFLLVAGGSAAAGAGAATYYMGKFEQTFYAPLPRVYDAAVATLTDQGLELQEQKHDKLTAHLESAYADGKHVWIDMVLEPPQNTAVTVRVGILPDKERALLILKGIGRRL